MNRTPDDVKLFALVHHKENKAKLTECTHVHEYYFDCSLTQCCADANNFKGSRLRRNPNVTREVVSDSKHYISRTMLSVYEYTKLGGTAK